ncbi:MAG: threonine ammonia-lyase, biosynthetic [Alphaproteobacteria bacterium CG_4_10_14_0_2_um_filter_63_37]|nr:MAG: PLP-dependent threonine dehydratase [Proteobacteria bacterium CG1_02_64_396]PJA23632.1 MAG: threonine ammonia-lyase, biosynthetic [Alphaproteobacteria bacterium CG_4_10_14_0_2_um_filter_63_37]
MQGILRRILTARVYDVARQTPLDPAPKLSALLARGVFLKREDLQPVFSFKLRGAYNKIAHLDPMVRAQGVIAASAGNHAQGVALSAKHFGIPAVIVMPATTPAIKVEAVRAYGAEVVLFGDSYSDAAGFAEQLTAERGLTYIHPYDDKLVIAGQGTIAHEILNQLPGGPRKGDTIFVPVGGGGLIAGIAAFFKAIAPEVRIIGVEPSDADAMIRSVEAGERVTLERVGIFADGVAVKQVGELTFEICRRFVDGWVRVSTDEIASAIKRLFEENRSIAEPAGALASAGMVRWGQLHPEEEGDGGRWISLVSGANMNFDRLRHVAERAAIGEQREALLGITIPERPGAFLEMVAALDQAAITEFNYRLCNRDQAYVFAGVAVAGPKGREHLLAHLAGEGFEALDLTDDEVAKLHLRHMVGGRAPFVDRERLVRFRFPERPGALREFLEAIQGRWNIALFHYRNFGADFGRVLVGMEVPEEDEEHFAAFLAQVGYEWNDESDNRGYKLFL